MRWWFLPFFLIYFYWKIWRAKRFYTKSIKHPTRYSDLQREKFVARVGKKVLFLWKVKVTLINKNNIPSRASLFIANHQSNMDPIMLFVNLFMEKPIGFIAKKELSKSKLVAPFLNLLDTLYIDRENPRSAIDAFEKARILLVNKKDNILIFPEGTRSKSATMGEFKSGAFKIAYLAYCPIVPIVINHSYKATQKNKKKLEITIEFLEALQPGFFAHRNTQQVADLVKERIQEKIIN